MTSLALPHESIRIHAGEQSAVGEVRRKGAAFAQQLGLSEVAQGRLALILTEAAMNLVEHGNGGDVLLRGVTAGEARAIEMLAFDKGPGMANPAQCMRDGFSTKGTAGAGLGSIARNASAFDLFSAPGKGTVIWAQVWHPAPPEPLSRFEVGAVCVPLRGEAVCGDAWSVSGSDRRLTVLVVDGLGHGQAAADAAHEAIRLHHQLPDAEPTALLEHAHRALAHTRGAAAAVACIEPRLARVRFAGVGNVAGRVVTGDATHRFASHNGTVGSQLSRLQQFQYPWEPDSLLLLHTDGVSSNCELNDYPGLGRKTPAVIAAALYRDFDRGRDDSTLLVVRERPVHG